MLHLILFKNKKILKMKIKILPSIEIDSIEIQNLQNKTFNYFLTVIIIFTQYHEIRITSDLFSNFISRQERESVIKDSHNLMNRKDK